MGLSRWAGRLVTFNLACLESRIIFNDVHDGVSRDIFLKGVGQLGWAAVYDIVSDLSERRPFVYTGF